MAYDVLRRPSRKSFCRIVTTFALSNFGNGGNSSSGNPRILKKLWPLRIDAAFFASTSMETSLEGNSRIIVKSRRAGSVVAPSFSTFASKAPRTPTSRSVVVRRTSVPFAWSRTLERIGSVVRVLTTFCTCCKPSSSFSLLTLNFITKPRLRFKAVDFVRQLESRSCHVERILPQELDHCLSVIPQARETPLGMTKWQ